jgi:hypothetical protein
MSYIKKNKQHRKCLGCKGKFPFFISNFKFVTAEGDQHKGAHQINKFNIINKKRSYNIGFGKRYMGGQRSPK